MNFMGQSFLNDRLFTDLSGKERRPRRLLNPMVGQWSAPPPTIGRCIFLRQLSERYEKYDDNPPV